MISSITVVIVIIKIGSDDRNMGYELNNESCPRSTKMVYIVIQF